MGCTASKLDNEDTVRRCKERRRLMKEAVHARHHLAAAHADYCRSLRVTGSALCSFAAGESLSVSEQTAAVFLHTPDQYPPSSNTTIPIPPRVPPSPSPSVHPPPPPPPFSPSPSPTIASSKLPHILSASSVDSNTTRLPRRVKRPPKLPHILSESSPASSPPRSELNYGYPTAYQANSTYSRTPSQASSVWNWENFYPPSPPDSEFFHRKAAEARNQNKEHYEHHHLNIDDDEDDTDHEVAEGGEETETERSTTGYDFFLPQTRKHNNFFYNHNKPAAIKNNSNYNGSAVGGEETEREEVQTSEWGDHDHFTSTSSSDEDDDERGESRSEIRTRSNFGSESVKHYQQQQQQQPQQPQPPPIYRTGKSKSSRSEGAGTSASFRSTGEISDNMKMVVRHKDLKEIVDAIRDNFDKAAAAGDQVSEMLEIGRAQLDRSFRKLKSIIT